MDNPLPPYPPSRAPTTRNPWARPLWTAPGCRWADQPRGPEPHGHGIGEAVGLADVHGWAQMYLVHSYQPAAPGHPARVTLSVLGRDIHIRTAAMRNDQGYPWPLPPDAAARVFPADTADLRALHLTHRSGVFRSALHTDHCDHLVTDGLFETR